MTIASNPLNQWLVRTAENFVAGPYTRDQIRQLMRESQLGLQDEVCQANGYWIYLHEKEEVVRHLGADTIQWLGESGEEITLTQTESSIEEIELTEKKAAVGLDEGDGLTTVIAPLPPLPIRLRDRKPALTPASALQMGSPVAPADLIAPRDSSLASAPLIHVSPSGNTEGTRWRIVTWFVFISLAIALALWLEMSR